MPCGKISLAASNYYMYFAVLANELVRTSSVELNDDANDVRLEHRRAHVGDATASDVIVLRCFSECRAFQIDDDAIRGLEREVVDFDRWVDADNDLCSASRRHYADGLNGRSGRDYFGFCVAFCSKSCCLDCAGCGYERESGKSRQELPHCVLTLVESFIATDSWRLYPNSSMPNTT